MKITNISCTQFAGVRDRNVSFADGINVIYGKNESGKSTLVNLLSRTLFQNARIDGRSDKEFKELFFPGAKKGSTVKGDFADGKITIETENGTYTLNKEWGSDAHCTLSTPDGIIRNQNQINEILKEILLYGEGVYSDILFSSQRNTDVSLQTILDASKKTDAKKEITNAVSQAFAETDGIPVDAIEQAIQAKIDEIEGSHWDCNRNAPVRKAGRWSNGLGEILKAYYKLEDAKAKLDEISALEAKADDAATIYNNISSAVQEADDAYNRFVGFASHLSAQKEREKNITHLENEVAQYKKVLADWPMQESNLEKAKTLKSERDSRVNLDKYEAVKKVRDEMAALEASIANLACPTDNEIKQVKLAQRSIASLENKLCGMNITAAIKMLDEHQVTVTSLRTGETVDVSNGIASITEAVKITVPGVMEMQLTPADVDAASIGAQIADQKNAITSIFGKYSVTSLEELEALAKKIADSESKLGNAQIRLNALLGPTTFEALETAVAAITDAIRPKDEIESDIAVLCSGTDISAFIAKSEGRIEDYVNKYGSIGELRVLAFNKDVELNKEKDAVSDTEDIPAEYRDISDPDAYLETLRKDKELKQAKQSAALAEKSAAAKALEMCKESNVDPAEEVEKAQRAFEEQESLLAHWKHIAEVFKAQKDSIQANPMEDIAARFTQYLGIISGGRVASEFPEADKLNMNIYSDDKLLDYNKLSEGTKETVSLAFRLAVLDHLFPDGGGIIVFDDPFTDMDAERTAQSCELIKECAKRHQVIFLTCNEDYLDVLHGNQVRF